jgi:hypothetical protein
MPSPPKGKRARTNDRPGLIGKRKRRTKAEVAAEKAAKVNKATIAATTEKRILTELAEIELEQEKMANLQRKAVIHFQVEPAADASTGTGTLAADESELEMVTSEDLTELIDEEMERFVDDGDDGGSDGSSTEDNKSGPKKGIKKVSSQNSQPSYSEY